MSIENSASIVCGLSSLLPYCISFVILAFMVGYSNFSACSAKELVPGPVQLDLREWKDVVAAATLHLGFSKIGLVTIIPLVDFSTPASPHYRYHT